VSISVIYDGTPLTDAVEDEDIDGLASAANYGEVGSGGMPIRSSSPIVGWKSLVVEESACSVPRIWTGYIADRPIQRFEPGTNALIWDCNLVDVNTLANNRIITGADGKRPAETDLARVSWLLGSSYLDDPAIVDSGFANVTDNPGNFGEADYRGQSMTAVLNDIAGTSGKLWYIYWDEVADAISLYYDLATATNRTSTLRISNDPADEDANTFAPLDTPHVRRSPEDIASGVYYTYKGNSIYREEPATATAHIRRDLPYTTDRVGYLATAEEQAAQYLDIHSTEFDVIELDVILPAAKVNLLLEGQRVAIKLQHIAPYHVALGNVYLRVKQRVVALSEPGFYHVHLELSNNRLHSRGVSVIGDGSNFPHQPPPETQHWWSGSGLVGNQSGHQVIGDPSPLFEPGIYTYQITIVEAPNPAATYATDVYFRESGTTGFIGAPILIDNTPSPGGDTTVYTGSFSIDALGVITNISSSDPLGPEVGVVDLGLNYDFLGSCAGPHAPKPESASEIFFWFDLAGFGDEPQPPRPGQRVNDETPVLVSVGPPATYRTRWPYADGSLDVLVDNLDQTAAVVESDPAAGEFTLSFMPTSTERVRVSYQGR
jgi:hypothetical protein